MSQVSIRLLGTPCIEVNHSTVTFGTRKAMALVAYLAVTEQTHTRDTLTSLLWPEYDYEQASAALRTTLWTARKQLGSQHLLVTRQQIGLQVSDEVQIDVREFRSLADSGLARDLPQTAAIGFLEKAIVLYQGDLLSGFTLKDSLEFDEWQLLETQNLRRMFGCTLHALVQHHTNLRAYAQALAYAQRQIGFDPLDETAHRNVMWLYVQIGQRAAALRQYDVCRQILDQQMGIVPSEETRQLRQAIEAEEFSRESTEGEVVPDRVHRGDTGPLVSGDLKARFYDRAEMVFQKPRRLIGRDVLVAHINRLLDDSETILLHGMGGMGKTSLAATVAADRITMTGQPVIWLEVGKSSVDTLFEAVARAFGQEDIIARKAGDERLVAIRELLLQKNALLVLDNVWNERALFHLLKAVPPSVPVMITSRQRFPVGPILDVTELAPADALALLCHHAYQTFDPLDPDALSLCRSLGYHPFALEIAGKTLHVDNLTPVELMSRVGSSPHQMTMPRSFADEGRESVKALLDVSIATLDEAARNTFLALGALFATTVTPDLMALCLDKPYDEVVALLSELQRRGLTERLHSAESDLPVYRVHDLTYSYARANSLLSQVAVIDGCREYAAQYTSALDALDAEIGNLLGAARAAHQGGMPDLLVEIMHLLTVSAGYCDARGYSTDALDLLNLAAQAAEDRGEIARAHYLCSKLGNAYVKYIEQFDRAFAFYDRAYALAQQMQDHNREILMLALLGTVRFRQGADDPDLYYERAYQLAKANNDEKALASVLNHRSYYEGRKNPPDFERSRIFSDEAVELARRYGMHESLFNSLMNRGNCERLLGRIETALATHGEAHELADRRNNHFWRASALRELGEDWHALGNRVQAQVCFDQSLALRLDTGTTLRARSLAQFMRQNGYTVDGTIP